MKILTEKQVRKFRQQDYNRWMELKGNQSFHYIAYKGETFQVI